MEAGLVIIVMLLLGWADAWLERRKIMRKIERIEKMSLLSIAASSGLARLPKLQPPQNVIRRSPEFYKN